MMKNIYLLILLSSLGLLFLLECVVTEADARRDPRQEDAKKEMAPENQKQRRKERLFSVFNIVTFKNDGCRSTSSIATSATGNQFRNGTCYTESECRSRGGTNAGSCAAGFGVCCVFVVSTSGGQITQNCTYIRNPGFPNQFNDANGGQVSYTVNKCGDNVCSLRLDFEAFTIQGTGATTEENGGLCLDTFTVTANTNQDIPTICGSNNGQHIYTELGTQSSDTAQISFNLNGAANNRLWEIKVTQVPCGSASRQPEGCLQYHTGLTGRFTSFNFDTTPDNHLQSQDYSVCIRQEAGFCCVPYSECTDTNSFSIDSSQAIATSQAMIESLCSLDYIGISGSSGNCLQGAGNGGSLVSKYCGDALNAAGATFTLASPVCDCTPPFIIDVFTDTNTDIVAIGIFGDNTSPSRGVCLEWMQIPCN